jgi:hypothetical protein
MRVSATDGGPPESLEASLAAANLQVQMRDRPHTRRNQALTCRTQLPARNPQPPWQQLARKEVWKK